MASFITAGNATNGLQVSSDNTGILELRTGTGSGTTAVTFSTGQRATFPSTIAVGNTTPATTGAGITFPAAQSASSDANTLDDYEEGTFTPTVTFGGNSTGMSYNRQYGRYTKIGNRVLVNIYISFTAKGSSTGVAIINGLPFTNVTASLTSADTVAAIQLPQVTYSGYVAASVLDNSTTMSIGQITTAGVASQLTDTNFANNSAVQIQAQYQTS